MNGAPRTGLFVMAAMMFIASVWGLYAGKSYRHGSFKAFYCAGRAVAQQADPYRVEPLRSCERAVEAVLDPGEVEPAPLPGYDLAAFALLSRFSFAGAALVFSLGAALAVLVAALLLAQVTRVESWLILLVLMPLSLLNIAYGEVPVIALAALVICGWAVRNERFAIAGVAGAATLVQPQIALPVLLALLIFVPRARWSLVITLLVLGAISLAAIGAVNNVEYARAVLPAQAVSELAAADQYSLSHLLYTAGVSAKAALAAAEACTAVMALAGLLCARAASARMHAPELIVFIPAAAILLGGMYLHDIQFIIALPAAIAVAARVEPARRTASWLALTALAVVWSQHPGRGVIALNVLAVLAAALAAAHGLTLARTAKGVVAAAAVCALVFALHAGAAAAEDVRDPVSPSANDLAANAWAAYVNATPSRTTESPVNVMLKVPTWIALATLLAASGLPRRQRSPVLTA